MRMKKHREEFTPATLVDIRQHSIVKKSVNDKNHQGNCSHMVINLMSKKHRRVLMSLALTSSDVGQCCKNIEQLSNDSADAHSTHGSSTSTTTYHSTTKGPPVPRLNLNDLSKISGGGPNALKMSQRIRRV